MAPPLRVDLVFSYWVFVWYLVYKIVGLQSFSPKFALTIGLLENTLVFFLMLIYGTSMRTIVFFLIINTLIKVLPLYSLRNEPAITWRDVWNTGLIFAVFVIWLHINRQSMVGNMKLIYYSLLYGQNKTPLMALFAKNFRNLQVI
jgi:hypothetical protein